MDRKFKNFTILYIEDDEGIREVNYSMLQRIFKSAYEAADGETGFKIYKEKKPDIIITDIKMPKINGIDLIKKIRQIDKKTKIIITTAFNDEEYLLEAVELGLERYLIKPLTRRNLLPALEKAVKELEQKFYISSDFYFDFETSLFYYKGIILELTKKELNFLILLIKNRSRIITYNEIEEIIWESKEMSIKSLRSTIGLLRKKFHII